MTDTKPSEREAFECHKLNQRMAGLLNRIAAALKGDPGPHRMHSWHDLPDLAAQAMQAVRAQHSAQLIRPAPAAREPLTFEEWWESAGPNTVSAYESARSTWEFLVAHGVNQPKEGSA